MDNYPDYPVEDDLSTRDWLGAVLGFIVAGLLYLGCQYIFMKNKELYSNYGIGLFVVLPILAGFVAGLISNKNRNTSVKVAWLTALAIYFLVMLAMMIFAIEGIVCLLMALPLAVPFIALGVFSARALSFYYESNRNTHVSFVPVLALVSLGLCFYDPGPVIRTEETKLIINAPPEKIWPYLFELHNVPSPDSWVLRTGVAFPVEVRCASPHVGAIRECVLSTGVMREHISLLVPNRILRFKVDSTPPPLRETNPFGKVQAPHEQGYFDVHWGEFRLEALPEERLW